MSEEIKNILEKVLLNCDTQQEKNKLYDYITNLQQEVIEVNGLSDRNIASVERMKEKYDELQEENEFLKLNNPEMNLEHFRVVKENRRKIDNLRQENKRIKEDYVLLQNASDEVEDKLNNNWNKLEEYIRSYINLLVNNPDMIEQGQLDILYEILDKMKELKDSDKE